MNYSQTFEEKSPFSFMLQLHLSEDEDSDLDVNICDLTDDEQNEPKDNAKVSKPEPGFVPIEIANRKPLQYVPAVHPDRKRKRSVISLTPEQAQATADVDNLQLALCGMMQGLGPMSGSSHSENPPNVFALNSRRPHRAENFRPVDRSDAPVPQRHASMNPPLYFHQP